MVEKYLLLVVPKDGPDYRYPTNIEIEQYNPVKTGIGSEPIPVFFVSVTAPIIGQSLLFPSYTDSLPLIFPIFA